MKPSKAEIIATLWTRGELSYKLHTGQQELYNLFWKSTEKINTWLLGRRSGKTFSLAVIGIEFCLKNSNSIIKFVAPTKTQMEMIILPIFKKVLEDCPPHLEPKYSKKTNIYYFHNGSEIHLGGADAGNIDRLRGSFAHICFLDEAGMFNDLEYAVNDVLLPTTLTTKGKVVLASTPPRDTEHSFVKFIEQAEVNGTLVKQPTKNNPLISKEEYEKLEESLGGPTSEAVRRELYCEIIRSSDLVVIPEFDETLQKEIIKEVDRPKFYDTYEAMDLGGKDNTGVLFAYYDFKSAKVIIEDELLVDFQQKEVSIPFLMKEIKHKEEGLWLNKLTGEVKPVSFRVSDINPIVTSEISKASNYEINFSNARKDDIDMAVNQVRLMLSQKKIIINPRCKNLIAQLKYAKWKNTSQGKREFARSSTYSHYDMVAALIYLIRSINYNKNPYPENYNLDPKDLFVINKPKSQYHRASIDPKSSALFSSIFKVKKNKDKYD